MKTVEKMKGYLQIFMAFFGLALCFSCYFLKQLIQIGDFPLEKCILYITKSAKAVIFQNGGCEARECSFPTPASARKV